MIVGKPDFGIDGLSRQERHDLLLERRDRLAFAQDDGVGLRRLHVAVLDRGDLDPDQLAGRRLLPLDREPGGPLLPEPAQLFGDHLIGDRRDLAG